MPSIPYQRRDEKPRKYLTLNCGFNGFTMFQIQEMRRYLHNHSPLRVIVIILLGR
jgi:hypothetical protein